MVMGDMPSFDDCLTLAVNGAGPGLPCLANSTASVKHIIIISDGDRNKANAALLATCRNPAESDHDIDGNGLPAWDMEANERNGRRDRRPGLRADRQ